MTNTKPIAKSKDPTQERLKKLESTVNALHHHLLCTLELTYILAAELAASKGCKQSDDATCTRILAEYNTLKGLNPIDQSFHKLK
ncbi:hypothetical protein VF14_11550 [Nostoc linckia z18]|uniref:Uncharacterized protein n=2 Tax=Nostoc linckia TaxID=92942 RepID=A0A9Q5Z9Z8_NOSLI|nr:hypothetical protein [Nostoc linckia]PHK40910.1 hypothetical protein VF12_08700 [Nostoc linckia z15]PHK46453.1 hypothetical protein VF13_10935 [Nostoc linckia z16]PHJ60253.1 hypothetical protein VF02_23090 [Nostoc linckia z1]PHJ63819.1 hypothetical protein VF05_24055 [Nostoc linckia z3]PHJ70833.1 hypothetical protein VF03_21625 [Nostoc linckia z2]